MRKPIIVMMTDDAFMTDYTILYDEMRKRGMFGTCYVIGDRPGTSFRKGRYMDWAKIKKMHELGWDMQCHSFTHQQMASFTEEQLRYEMESTNQAFLDNGLPLPKHHAFPFGSHSQLTRDIVREYRLTVRDTGFVTSQRNRYQDVQHGYLKGMRADILDEGYFNTVKETIDITKANNDVLTLYHHEIVDGTGEYMVKHEYLIRLLDYIEESGIEVMTLSKAYDFVLDVLSKE